MELFIAMRHEADAYTYSCDTLLGVYTSRELADERCLRHAEEFRQNLKDYFVDAIVTDADYEVREEAYNG